MRLAKANSRRLSRAIQLLVLALAATEALAQEKTLAARGARPRRHILVSLADRKLALMEEGRMLRAYPVSVGAKATPSPVGEFAIVTRIVDPTYYHPGTVIPAGDDNPLGPRWIGLNQRGYGIHGTNAPRSIGRAASHGCIRMRNRDVKELFEMVRDGDTVEIRSQRDAETAQLFAPSSEPVVAQVTTASAAGMP